MPNPIDPSSRSPIQGHLVSGDDPNGTTKMGDPKRQSHTPASVIPASPTPAPNQPPSHEGEAPVVIAPPEWSKQRLPSLSVAENRRGSSPVAEGPPPAEAPAGPLKHNSDNASAVIGPPPKAVLRVPSPRNLAVVGLPETPLMIGDAHAIRQLHQGLSGGLGQPPNERMQSLSGSNGSCVIDETTDLPSEITFEKISVVKLRTHSVQSVLSTTSLRALTGFTPFAQGPPDDTSRPQSQSYVNLQSHIQAPAVSTTLGKTLQIEIGTKMPFIEPHAEKRSDSSLSSHTHGSLVGQEIAPTSTYTPAQADLSSFASLTRMPISHRPAEVSENELAPKQRATTHSSQTPAHGIVPRFHAISVTELPSYSTPSPAAASRMGNRPSSTQLNVQAIAPLTQRNAQPPSRVSPESTAQTTPVVDSPTSSLRGSPLRINSQFNPVPEHLTTHMALRSPLLVVATSHDRPSPPSTNPSLQQIRDPRKPMYLPAVLRPPPDACVDMNVSMSLHDEPPIERRSLTPGQNFHNTLISSALRKQATTSSSSVRSMSSLSTLREGQPTRNHWRKNESRGSCSYCVKPFTFFTRRHHCRRCGDLFCADHVSHAVNLDHEAQFTLGGVGCLSKVCDWCIRDYEKFTLLALDDLKREQASELITHNQQSRPLVASVEGGVRRERKFSVAPEVTVVPADWNWSSF